MTLWWFTVHLHLKWIMKQDYSSDVLFLSAQCFNETKSHKDF